MKAIGYLRISKEDQNHGGLGLDAQLSDVVRIAAEISVKLTPKYDVERDDGVSGARPAHARPGLSRAMARLERGDVLLVARRDRLARDALEAMLIERELERRGARVVSAAGEGTEDDTPAARLFRRIVDAFAEYERSTIVFRTKKALEQKRVRGERAGGVPYGHDLAANGRQLVPNEREQTVLRSILAQRAAGCRASDIVAKLNRDGTPSKTGKLWSHAAVTRILNRKTT